MNVILSIAKTTVGEAIRRRVLLVILLIGVLFLVIAPGLQTLSARQNFAVLTSFALGIIQLTSAVIAIVLTVYMIPNEIERRTIYTILSKPVQRWQFILGKYFGAIAALAMMMALMSVAFFAVFYIVQPEARSQIGNIAKGPMMFFVQMSLLAAVAMLFSTFVAPIVNMFLSGGVYLVGTLFNAVFQTISENDQLPGLVKGAAGVIYTVVPNFGQFNISNPLINPGTEIKGETLFFVQLAGYAILYITVALIIAVIVFDRREV
ncbi:MAG: ABC transporter permease [Fimbriimonadaceae bacterium]|jgi:ABC-type transport system involved in multi-copper enzyme maturation permease subunit|nr:ABC transporter permease [Fimbriimonadaceae bacterium]